MKPKIIIDRQRERIGLATENFNPQSQSIIKKTLQLLSLCLLFSLNIFAQQKTQKIDGLLSKYAEYRQFNGTALVAKNGKVIFKKATALPTLNGKFPTKPIQNFAWAPSANSSRYF